MAKLALRPNRRGEVVSLEERLHFLRVKTLFGNGPPRSAVKPYVAVDSIVAMCRLSASTAVDVSATVLVPFLGCRAALERKKKSDSAVASGPRH